MQLPTLTQTMLDFSTMRILDQLNPITQINILKSSISTMHSDLLTGTILPIFLDSKSVILRFNRHVVSGTQYLDVTNTTKGYSNIAIISDIAESRLHPNNNNKFFNSPKYDLLNLQFELIEADSLSAALYPYDYIINYSTLSMSNAIKIALTSSIEDMPPSTQSSTSTLFIHDYMVSYLSSVFSSSIWTGYPYNSYIQSKFTDPGSNVSSAVIDADIAKYFGSNYGLLSRLTTYYFNSITGTSNLSPVVITKVKTAISSALASSIYPKLKAYFDSNMGIFIQNFSTRYIELLKGYHVDALTSLSLSSGLTAPTTIDDNALVTFFENDYFANYSDLLEDLDFVSLELSENAVDFLNFKMYLYKYFIESLDPDIDKYNSAVTLPTNIMIGGVNNPTNLAVFLDNYIQSITFASSDPINKSLLETAIGIEFTSVVKMILDGIFNSSVDFSNMFDSVDVAFSLSLDTNTSVADRGSKFMTLLTAAINYDSILDINVILPTFVSNVLAAANYGSVISYNTPNYINNYVVPSDIPSITRLSLASYYTYRMCATLDIYSINQIKV